jgi:hypothetical protein
MNSGTPHSSWLLSTITVIVLFPFCLRSSTANHLGCLYVYVTYITFVNKVVSYESEYSVACPDHSSTSPTGRNSLNRAQAASLLRFVDHKQLRPEGSTERVISMSQRLRSFTSRKIFRYLKVQKAGWRHSRSGRVANQHCSSSHCNVITGGEQIGTYRYCGTVLRKKLVF